MKNKETQGLFAGKNGANYLFPFIIVTSLFALWGFANDITNPMVAAFKNILLISNFESSLVQFAFYGGYCFMAIPAALFIRRFSYKRGILVGLGLYSAGCMLFIPAGNAMAFWAFLIAYFVMTCGLAFLETTSNPYVLSMGPEASATRRLNFAQAFNPIGSLTGMFVAKEFILARLNEATEEERKAMSPDVLAQVQQADLDVISGPYLMLGLVVLCFFVLFFVSRLPRTVSANAGVDSVGRTVKNLLKNRRYVLSVVAQTFYVGVQIMVWTFIIQYAGAELGMKKADAQFYNMIAMVCFVSSRFICTFLLKYLKPGLLLFTLAIGGALLILWTIFGGGNPEAGALLEAKLESAQGFMEKLSVYFQALFQIDGMSGLAALVGVSSCMSLMFPTIYGIALKGMGEEAKLASAGLILAIGGGCIMPPMQGWLIDKAVWFDALSSVRISFVLPLICFVVIACFGRYVSVQNRK
ncbi:MAG: L-fucose:H+ symporter permease [Prevotellaceae bacterium]|jgi:FHS family L-fucose permease-like MFS transporter|nr:L-fucose:H+ symporter permease [Prevotellaceae bacterium]